MADGTVDYDVTLGANTKNLEKSIDRIIKSIERLEDTLSGGQSQIQSSVNKSTKALKDLGDQTDRTSKKQTQAAKNFTDAFNFQNKQRQKSINATVKAAEQAAAKEAAAQRTLQRAMDRSAGRLENIEEKYKDVIKVAGRMGDTAAVRKAEQAMASYRDALNKGFKSSEDFTNATSEISQQMNRMRNGANKFESEMAKFVRATNQAARSTDAVDEQLKAMGASSEDVRRTMTPLNRALQRYQRALRDAGDDSVAIARAQADFAAATDRARREVRDLNDTLRRNRRETDRARDGVENLSGAMGALVASTGAFVSAYNLIEIARMADRYTEMANRLHVVSDATANVAEDMRTMMNVAIDTRSSLDGVTDVFSKLTRANDRYGKSQEEILKITTAVSQAVSMSGATAQGAEGALIQFSQAISNNFQAAAQEINSINEQTPALADAIALALTSVGKYGEVARADLKRLASEGRLSAGDLLDGFVNVADEIEERFNTATATMAQGFENFKDSAVISIGEVGRATGITEKIATTMQELAAESQEAAAGITGVAAAASALAGSIGIAGIIGLGTIMGPLAVKVALVGTAISALVGVFVAAKAETALFEQKMADLREESDAVLGSLSGITSEKYTWEDSSFNAWMKSARDDMAETRDNIKSLEEDILELANKPNIPTFNQGILGGPGAPSGNEEKLHRDRMEREEEIHNYKVRSVEYYHELSMRLLAETTNSVNAARDEELRTIVETNDKRLTGLAAFKEEAEDFYRFLSNNADQDLLDTRRMQLGKDLLKGIGIEAEDMGMLVSDNANVIDAAMVMLAETAASPAEVFEFLKNNIDTTNTSLAESEDEIKNLYEGMNNATGVTAAFSAEVARLGSIMVTAAAAGNTEMVGMIREIIIEMNKQYNANIEAAKQATRASATSTSSRISDAEREAKARKKSVESIINNIQGMSLEQDRARQSLQELKTGGVSAMEDLRDSFAIDDTIKALVDEFEELDKKGKLLAIQELDEYFDDVSISADNYAKYLRKLEEEKAANVKATDKLIEAEQELQGIVEGAIGRSKDLEDRMAAMTNIGFEASDIKTLHEAVESFDKMGKGQQDIYLEKLKQQFPELTWEVETFGNSIEQVFRQNNAVEEWANTVEDVGNRIGSTLEETIKGGLDGSINSFADAADRLKDMMKQLLIDLAYQAAIEPIVVGIKADVMGAMSGQGGGLGNTSNAINNIMGMFSGGGGSGLGGMQGGLSNAAILSANTIAGGSAGAALGGMQGGLSSAAITSANQVAGGSAAASGGMMSGMSGMAASAGTAAAVYAAMEAANWLDQKFSADAKYGVDAGGLGVGINMVSKGLFGGSWEPTGNAGFELGASEDGFSGRQYAEERKSGGLFKGSSYKDVYSEMDSELEANLAAMFNAQKASLEKSADMLGVQRDYLGDFAAEATQINTQDMSEEEAQKAIEGWLTGVMDDAAMGAVNQLDSRMFDIVSQVEGVNIAGLDDFEEGIKKQMDDISGTYESGIGSAAKVVSQLRELEKELETAEEGAAEALNMAGLIQALTDVGDEIGGAVTEDIFRHLEHTIEAGVQSVRSTIDGLSTAVPATAMLEGAAERLNLQFNATADGAIHAAFAMQESVGGLENLANIQSSYYDNYFTEEEKKAQIHKDLTSVFSDLNMTMPESISGFRDIVESLDLNSESGREAYASLLSVQGAFKDIAKEADKFEAAISKRAELDKQILQLNGDTQALRQLEIDALKEINGWQEKGLVSTQREIWAIKGNIAAREKEKEAAEEARREAESYWSAVNSSLKSISGWVDNFMATEQSPTLNMGSAAEDFREQFEKAASGDRDALSNITQYADRFLSAGELMYASGDGYQSIQDEVLGKLKSLPDPESDVQYLARRFNESITNNLPQAITDTIKSLEYEIDSMIAFASDDTNVPKEYRDLLRGTLGNLEASVDYLMGNNELSPDLIQLALGPLGRMSSTVDYLLGDNQLSEDLIRIALGPLDDMSSTMKYLLGKNELSEDLIKIAIGAVDDISQTVNLVLGSTLSEDQMKLALGSIEGYTANIDFAVRNNTIPAYLKELVIESGSNYSAYVNTLLGLDNLSDQDMVLAFESGNTYSASVNTLLKSDGLTNAEKRIALQHGNNYNAAVNTLLGKNTLSAANRTLALENQNQYNAIVGLSSAGWISHDVRRMALESGNDYETTVELLSNDTLTSNERRMALQSGNTYNAIVNTLLKSDGLTNSEKRIALENGNNYQAAVTTLLGRDILSANNRRLALENQNQYNAIVRLSSAGWISGDVRKMALESGNDYKTSVELLSDDTLTSAERRMALQSGNTYNAIVKAVLGTSNFNALGLATDSSNRHINTFVRAIESKISDPNAKRLALESAANRLNTYVTALRSGSSQKQAEELALRGASQSVRTYVQGLLHSRSQEDAEKLALDSSNRIYSWIEAKVSGRAEPDAIEMALNNANSIRTTINGVLGRLSGDVRKVALGSSNRLLTTLEASLDDGKLSDMEKNILSTNIDDLVRGIQVSGQLNLSDDEWAVINAASGSRKLDLLADVAFNKTDLNSLGNIDSNTKRYGPIWKKIGSMEWEIRQIALRTINNSTGIKVSWARNHNHNAFQDLAWKIGQEVGTNGSHATGLGYVPFDGYTAELHKGEMVVPAKSAEVIRQLEGSGMSQATPSMAAPDVALQTILPESSPTMDFALASAIRELKNEIRDLRRDSNERLDKVEDKADESNAIDREGYLALIARLQQSNELLSDMEESTTLNRSRD